MNTEDKTSETAGAQPDNVRNERAMIREITSLLISLKSDICDDYRASAATEYEANARLIVASVNHAQALAEALRDIRDACFDTSIGIETNRVGRIYSVAKAAVQIWEGARK